MWFSIKKADALGGRDRPMTLEVPADLTMARTSSAAATTSTGLARRIVRAVWRRLSWKGRALVVLPLGGAAALAVMIAGLLTYYTATLTNPLELRKQQASPSLKILASDGTVMLERGQAADYMPLDLLPRHMIEAVIATEDRRFYDHWGLDPAGLARAAFANLRMRRFAQGGSTLTQQLAKNLYLTSERTLSRKVDELLLALWLEARLSKDEILELYLNRVYFGGGAFGIEAAARRYFDKSARELTVIESAVLAGLLKAPTKFSPSSNPVQARTRARVVLAKMSAAGFISDADASALARTPIRFQEPQSSREQTGLEYAVDYVLEQLPYAVRGSQRDIIVETTIDATLQRAAQAELARVLATSTGESAASQGGVVALDPDGGVRVLVGGRSYLESQFNRATKAKRQPGSAFKMFVYLNALESGLTPESTVYDLPVAINGWSPRNENGSYRGSISLRQALSQSINSVAVRLHVDLGMRRTTAAANRLGVRSELHDGPSLALGTSEVTLLEMTAAYGVFANGGASVAPYVIERVATSSGQVLYQRPLRSAHIVVAPRHVAEMNDMLNATLVSGTGRQASIANHPAAGKTGTSQDFRDAWFIGYTSHLVGGVWIGNDNGKPMNRIMGGTIPARVWRTLMTQAHEGRKPLPLPGTTVATDAETPPPPIAQRTRSTQPPRDLIANLLGKETPAATAAPRDRIDDRFIARAAADDAYRPKPGPRPADTAAAAVAAASNRAPVPAIANAPSTTWAGFNATGFGDTLRRLRSGEAEPQRQASETRRTLDESRMSLGRKP